MEITKLEKAALITTGAAAAYKTLLWSLLESVDSTNGWIVLLRVLFAFISFAAFDLIMLAVVARGWSWSGATALIVAGSVAAAIGLSVGTGTAMPALHAAPAITLGAFGLHLMRCRTPASTPPEPTIMNNTQINVGVLPRTFAAFAAARARELPDATPAQLAAELGTSESTVRRLLDRAPVINTIPEEG